MIWFYFDANALAKRYSTETGTGLINELFRCVSVAQMTCLTLSILEVMSILVRKKNDGRLSPIAFDQAMINFRSELINNKEFAKAPINDLLVMSAFGFIGEHYVIFNPSHPNRKRRLERVKFCLPVCVILKNT